jgi:hypothetical protein
LDVRDVFWTGGPEKPLPVVDAFSASYYPLGMTQGVRKERSHGCVTDEQPEVREAHDTMSREAATFRVDAEGGERSRCACPAREASIQNRDFLV